MYKSIAQLIELPARKYSNLPVFSLKSGFRTKTYTYGQVLDYSLKVASLFKKYKIKSQDKIVVLSHNRPEYSILILGSLLSGVTLIPIDYRTNSETISKFVKKTKPKAIFTSKIYKNLFKVKLNKYYFDDLFSDLVDLQTLKPVKIDKQKTAAILFTSGTTGDPKGTIISYKNILGSINNITQVFSLPVGFRILSILPLSHVLELCGGLLTAYSLGCHLHYLERVNSITITKSLVRYKIQCMTVVPQMLRLLLQNVEREVIDQNMQKEWDIAQNIAPYLPFELRKLLFGKLHKNLGGHFELFISGGAPLEQKLSKIWQNTGIKVIEGYGASESTGFIATNTQNNNKLGTVGRILPGIVYKFSDTGELLVSGDNIVSGYFDNPKQTKETFKNGWFNTGDIVEIDNKGFIRIVGRDKFKIVLADGKKVYPEDIEKKLDDHDDVIDSAVFGVPSETGEIVHAELIVKPKAKVKEIILDVNKNLNPHEQIMDYGIWTESDFPRTKTLKIDHQAVKDKVLANAEVASKGHFAKSLIQAHFTNDKLLDILHNVTEMPLSKITEKSVLTTDLRIDSLKRIELLAVIEEDMGVSIEEMGINPKTTVMALRKLIKDGKPNKIDDGEHFFRWQFNDLMDSLRVNLQDFIAFPLFNIPIKVKLLNPENLKYINTPQLFIFNHVGVHDVVQILRVMPKVLRAKTAIAATSEFMHQEWFKQYFPPIFGNTFPFVKAETNLSMRSNFDRVGELLDKGYNVMISPEGNITDTGKLLPFHTGAGYIAVEMGVPVTIFKMTNYFELWPDDLSRSLNVVWPKKSGEVQIKVSMPITFKPGTSYEKATEIMRKEMLRL